MQNIFTIHTYIIYKITNKSNKKCYIGQTIYSFNHRYKKGEWWKYTTNRYLKNAVNKYGIDNFFVEILEYNKTLDELNTLEEKYAIEFNAYVPNGYNLIGCGRNKIKHQKSLDLYTKEIILNNPQGVDVKIKNITKFCRDNGLDSRTIYRVISGRFASHRGWSLQGQTNKVFRNKKSYTFYDLQGNKYDIVGLTDFCKLKSLNYNGMRDMLQGKISNSQGFVLDIKNYDFRRKKYKITLENINGQTIELDNIKEQCRQYNLYSKYIYDLINHKLESYKGWKIKELTLQ